MKLQVITVSAKNKHTGKFSIQLNTIQSILNGETNGLIIVDEEFRDDPLTNGKFLKGTDLWKTVGKAISNGFLKHGNSEIFFVADR